MKQRSSVLLILAAALCASALPSCAYSIPNGGQAVLTDVTDVLTGQPIPASNGKLMAAAPSSATHAQSRAQQSSSFWGGAQ